jgi:predicted nucleic acid-binding protein
VAEPATPAVRRLVESDSSLVVWWLTRTECVSALARRRRDGQLTSQGEQRARHVLARLAEAWAEVLPTEPLRLRTERLLAVHALRCADAFRLAAALLWSRGNPAGHTIVSFDDRLREAGRREGFHVLPEE